ncbi:MAG: fimbrillin family protein [Prevotellaceae bacterium]|jgi:hypothetical protein|nr:fimbrillin family protein [Prevotellaceae bacterium]
MNRSNLSSIGILSLTTLLLAACNQDVMVNQSPGTNSGKYIAFNPLTGRSDTRAEVINNDNLENFATWAAASLPAATTDDFVLNDELVYRQSDNSWTYEPPALWSAATMDFYAYAPALSKNVTTKFAAASSTIAYTVPKETTAGQILQEDFLIARSADVASGGDVTLQFQHALSRAVFRAKSAVKDINLVIKKVTLNNLHASGTFDFENPVGISKIPAFGDKPSTFEYDETHATPVLLWTPTDDATTDYDVAITEDTYAPVGAEDSYSNASILITNTMTQLHRNADALMILPQTTDVYSKTPSSTGFFISVTWALASNPKDTVTTEFPVLFPDTGSQFAFEAGRQYTFDITMTNENGVNVIKLRPEVSDWQLYDNEDDGKEDVIPVPRYVVGDIYLGEDGAGSPTDGLLVYATDGAGKATKIAMITPNTNLKGSIDATKLFTAGGDIGTALATEFKTQLGVSGKTLPLDIKSTDLFWSNADLEDNLNICLTAMSSSPTELMVMNPVTDNGGAWNQDNVITNGTLVDKGLNFWILNASDAKLTTYENMPAHISETAGLAFSYTIIPPTFDLTINGEVNWVVSDSPKDFDIKILSSTNTSAKGLLWVYDVP